MRGGRTPELLEPEHIHLPTNLSFRQKQKHISLVVDAFLVLSGPVGGTQGQRQQDLDAGG